MKILVLGNETKDTDYLTSELANGQSMTNHGLISDKNFKAIEAGYYHTSMADLTPGDVVHMSEQFDQIIMLDQNADSYPHYKNLVTTLRLMYDLEAAGKTVEYQNNKNAKNFLHWREYLKQNKSFCFYPFLAMVDNIGTTCICPKSRRAIKPIENIINWQTDKEYNDLRNKMLAGTPIPEHCSDCYSREAEGQESTRQYETLEWVERIKANAPEDFLNYSSPLYYEIRPSNKCNIMCRTCDDGHSHLIEREWRKHKEIPLVPWRFNNTMWDKIDFTNIQKIYVGGGEPTVITEFYDFLRRCIDHGYTDFEIDIGTNGMKFSNTLLELMDHFSHICLSFSYDGVGRVNDYIRWGSDFDTIVNNARTLKQRGHKIALQTVFSMYSITRMHEVFEFFDKEYPDSGLLVQVAEGLYGMNLPYNHPRPDLVIKSMRQCQQTKTYYVNGRSVKSMIDLLIDHYSNPNYTINKDLLKQFYEFNDKLDRYRNSRLEDYIPELAQARREIWPT